MKRNSAFYVKYPQDADRIKHILHYLGRSGDGNVKLPHGGALTRRRFQQIGFHFGMPRGLDYVDNIVLHASDDIEQTGEISLSTLRKIQDALPFSGHDVIHSMLFEAMYCEGEASNWSAHRTVDGLSEFDLDRKDGPVYLTGEMVFPWMFEDEPGLHKVKELAERLASDTDWPALFDEAQLARNEVQVCSASNVNDMSVRLKAETRV